MFQVLMDARLISLPRLVRGVNEETGESWSFYALEVSGRLHFGSTAIDVALGRKKDDGSLVPAVDVADMDYLPLTLFVSTLPDLASVVSTSGAGSEFRFVVQMTNRYERMTTRNGSISVRRLNPVIVRGSALSLVDRPNFSAESPIKW